MKDPIGAILALCVFTSVAAAVLAEVPPAAGAGRAGPGASRLSGAAAP